MSNIVIKDTIEELIEVVQEKKAEDIRLFSVSEHNWMTEYVLVVGVKTPIHGKAVVEDVKKFFSRLPDQEDVYTSPKISGQPESGWTVVDANSVVVHCINVEKRTYYDIDTLFEAQGDVYHY